MNAPSLGLLVGILVALAAMVRLCRHMEPVYSAIYDLETSLAAKRDTIIDQPRGSEVPVRILLLAVLAFAVVTEGMLPGLHRGNRW